MLSTYRVIKHWYLMWKQLSRCLECICIYLEIFMYLERFHNSCIITYRCVVNQIIISMHYTWLRSASNMIGTFKWLRGNNVTCSNTCRYVKIQLEDINQYRDALEYIKKCPPQSVSNSCIL